MPDKPTIGLGTFGTIELIGEGVVTVGKFCSLAKQIKAIMFGHLQTNISTFPFTFFNIGPRLDAPPIDIYGPVTIGNDVCIGYGVTLFGGVTVGNGAIIGSRAVVTRDVAPYAVVAGSPVLIRRKRFEVRTW